MVNPSRLCLPLYDMFLILYCPILFHRASSQHDAAKAKSSTCFSCFQIKSIVHEEPSG